MLKLKRVRIVVHGRVQGVGFRYFAQDRADDLQLTGIVRNLRDGGVEVIAEGEEGALEALVVAMKNGPVSARVEDAQVIWLPYQGEYLDFRISHTF